SRSLSLSRRGRCRRAARSLPTLDLPVPMSPTSTTGRPAQGLSTPSACAGVREARSPGHGKLDQAADEPVAPDAQLLDGDCQLQPGELLEQRAEHDLQFDPSQWRTQTVVGSVAERQVWVALAC